jgi:hypothetical protein
LNILRLRIWLPLDRCVFDERRESAKTSHSDTVLKTCMTIHAKAPVAASVRLP